MVIVTTDQIYDARKNGLGGMDACRKVAFKAGKPFLLFNGVIYDVNTEDEVFLPPFGFWVPETMPFIGWKEGYEYSGTHEWLLGKNVPCAPLDNA